MDPATTLVFQKIAEGGPDVIFLLCVFISLFLIGALRLKREVDDKDKENEKLVKINNELLAKIDRQQDLNERSLDMLDDQIKLRDSQRRTR